MLSEMPMTVNERRKYINRMKLRYLKATKRELSGALANTEGAPTQEFRVIPHARYFGKATPPFRPGRAFFGKRPV